MRRVMKAGCIATIGVAVLGTTRIAEAQSIPGGQVNVAVDIRCLAGNGVSFSVAPWTAPLAPGDSIAWILNPDAGVAEITIVPKDTKKWPYDDAPPFKGNAKAGPKLKKMKSTVKAGEKYSYNITASCQRADGTVSYIVVDPDMIILPGGR